VRLGPFVVLLVATTLLVALALLTVWHAIAAGSLGAGFPVAARTLFLFGDIAFYLWIPFLVIAAARLRRRPAALGTFLVLAAGGILNVLAVFVIGLVQTGGIADFVAIGVEGSLASVLGGAVAIPTLYHLTSWGAAVKAPRTPSPPL
jgi:hypothetical protein